MLDGLGHQQPVGLRAQDHEAAVGLNEDLEQAIEQFAEHFVQTDRLAEVVRDLDHGPQLHFGVDRQPHAGVMARAAHVELRHDRRAAHRRGVVMTSEANDELDRRPRHGSRSLGRPCER